ncbi:MAG: permease [Candidatus Odinarchaeota archaeon]
MQQFIETGLTFILNGIDSALTALFDYLSFHVLLCLVPAFFIAGAMVTFVPKDKVLKYLGPEAKAYVAYPVAAGGGFILAVCSCTVLPLFAGIWKKGAGLGPSITFLFAAPAINLLALAWTGSLISMDLALWRGMLAILFAVLIGMIMAKLFSRGKENETENGTTNTMEQVNKPVLETKLRTMVMNAEFLLFATFLVTTIPILFINFIPLYLIALAILLILTKISSRDNLLLFSWLIFILFSGTSQINLFPSGIMLGSVVITTEVTSMLGKTALALLPTAFLILFVRSRFDSDEVKEWMSETWIFFKMIFPLILIGVTIAGFIKFIVPAEIIVVLVGRNTVLANAIGVIFGIVMYFPTLAEVPIARAFLEGGMAMGPLLAYLLADPELSIQSILVTRKMLGDKRNLVFVVLVAIFSIIGGLIFGLISLEGIGMF